VWGVGLLKYCDCGGRWGCAFWYRDPPAARSSITALTLTLVSLTPWSLQCLHPHPNPQPHPNPNPNPNINIQTRPSTSPPVQPPPTIKPPRTSPRQPGGRTPQRPPRRWQGTRRRTRVGGVGGVGGLRLGIGLRAGGWGVGGLGVRVLHHVCRPCKSTHTG